MTVTQIESFEAVCRTMSFTKAANSLYISQPAISKSISKLEQELGVRLFEQEGGSLILTPEGELFSEFVRNIREEYTSFMDRLSLMRSAASGAIRLGCPETWNPAAFEGPLQRCFGRSCPSGQLWIEAQKLSELLLRLQSGRLDMVLTHEFYSPAIPGIRALELTSTEVGVLYSKEHFGDGVTFETLAGSTFLVFDTGIEKRFSAAIRSICKDFGCEAKVRISGQLQRSLFDVSRGKGVMLFTDWDSVTSNPAYGYLKTGVFMPVKLMYYADRLSADARAFVSASAEMFRGNIYG
ncbi:MAG: LysR family transcriptional regulator [Oscillospiraceae bacterium]|nr:LysR family transcriptional regulator [Oscillospiraceae bacterium]